MIERIRELTRKIFMPKTFRNIFVCLFLLIVFVFGVIYAAVSSYAYNLIVERERKYNGLILQNVSGYVGQKLETVREMALALYENGEEAKSVMYFLEHPVGNGSYEALNLKRTLDTYFFTAFGADADISSITVCKTLDGRAYHYGRALGSVSEFDSPAPLAPGGYEAGTLTVYPSEALPFDDSAQAYTIAISVGSLYESRQIAALYVTFRADGITDYLRQYTDSLLGEIVVCLPDGRVLYDSGGRFYGGQNPACEGEESLRFGQEEYLVNQFESDESDVSSAGLIPKSLLRSKTQPIRTVIILFTTGCLVTLLVLIYLTMRLFSSRMDRLTKAMASVRRNHLQERIAVGKVRDEFDELSVVFNAMCDDLESYIEKYYLAELRQKEAMLTALESQIDPHFLSNTLEAIRMKAISNGDREAADMIYLLSRLFRSAVRGEPFLPLRDEVRYCKMYLQLFEIRYEKGLDAVFAIDPEIERELVPKNILQPVVENYIMHGFIPGSTDNKITICGKRVRGQIVVMIRDNGCGMNRERLLQIRGALADGKGLPRGNIGLANVAKRLWLKYGGKSGVTVYSRAGRGTAVFLKIDRKEETACTE